METHTEQQIKIRQLTKVQASWTEQERESLALLHFN